MRMHAMFEKPDRHIWENLTPREGAQRFLEFLQEAARGALSEKNKAFLTGAAKRELKRALEQLPLVFGQVANGCDDHLEVWRLMGLCYQIGKYSNFTKSQKNFARHRRAVENAKNLARTRRDEMNEGWRPHAFEIAIETRKQEPSIIQTDLAKEIANRWRLRISCPRSQLILAIREWERSGELPKRIASRR
jgi:hypothetical protein